VSAFSDLQLFFSFPPEESIVIDRDPARRRQRVHGSVQRDRRNRHLHRQLLLLEHDGCQLMIVEIEETETLRIDASEYTEVFSATAATGTCIGNCCCSTTTSTN
jgi:hypothetical protein